MNDDDKTDDQENIGGTIKMKPSPEGRPLPKAVHDLRNQLHLSKGAIQYTPTMSAYTSAEVLTPDQAPAIKAYQAKLKKADKGDVFALSTGKVQPKDVGIQTELKSDVTETYAQFEYSEQQEKGSRKHDISKILLGAVIGLLIWAAKELLFSG